MKIRLRHEKRPNYRKLQQPEQPDEEAPEARAGPHSPDAFYRGEEAGAVLNPCSNYVKAALSN